VGLSGVVHAKDFRCLLADSKSSSSNVSVFHLCRGSACGDNTSVESLQPTPAVHRIPHKPMSGMAQEEQTAFTAPAGGSLPSMKVFFLCVLFVCCV
jgi:hypothetical protein